MMALVFGAVIAVAALAYILYPIFSSTRPTKPAADATIDEEIEAAVRAYREGKKTHDRCAECGTPVAARDARYCASCGKRLPA